MESNAAAAVAVLPAELAADRRPHSRRPLAFAAWLFMGGVGTYIDKIHEWLGVVAYPNKDWVGEQLPVSPAYLSATIGFFLLYTLVVGHRGRSQGLFGGKPISWADFALSMGSWIAAYTVTGILGAPGNSTGWTPWLAMALLWAWAAPDLWSARRTWLFVFVLLVAALGVGFEWTATSNGAFSYPVCPSEACLGTTVPALWLAPLYVHAALFIHRLLGGRHWLKRWLERRPA